MLIRVTCLFIFLMGTNALATPLVQNINGAFESGCTVSISGSGFGTHDLNIEWRGNEIEAGQAGEFLISQDNWYYTEMPNEDWVAPKYSTTMAHSGKQSLEVDLTSYWQCPLRYDSGTGIAPGTTLFVSWWVYLSDLTGDGQWKMFRINWQNDIQDDYPQMVMFNWYNANALYVRPGPDISSNVIKNYPAYPDETGRWYRMDVVIKESSLGVPDGFISTNTHDPEMGSAVKVSSESNIMTYYSGERRHQWFLWQNYRGNGLSSLRVFLDDIYVQPGTQARVEIGDDENWADCSWREIQIPTAWSSDTVVFQVNKGSFKDGDTAYLFVVDADGNASSGHAIIIGGPASPLNLRIIQ